MTPSREYNPTRGTPGTPGKPGRAADSADSRTVTEIVTTTGSHSTITPIPVSISISLPDSGSPKPGDEVPRIPAGSVSSASAPIPTPQPPAPAVAPSASPTPEIAPRRVAVPPQPHDRLKLWSSLLISVLICLPPLLVCLNVPDLMPGSEARSLQMSRETWRRQSAGDRVAWLMPSVNGQPQVARPPMSVWINLLAWRDLDESTASPRLLILRARLAAVLMGIVALLATYWAGSSIGDVRTARIATMALGTTWLFIDQVRIATTSTHLLGFVCIAIAAGLWAMRPLKDIAWVGRRVFGWLIAGIALGAAVLTSGAIGGTIFVLPPLVAAIILTPRRRIDNALGLVFAVILGLVIAAPWYLYVLTLNHTPEAARLWLSELQPPAELFVLSYSHWKLAPMLWPWPIWLLGALCQPFVRADPVTRRQLLIAWFWFVLIFITLSIPASNNFRLLLPALPAAALMIGQLWSFHAQLATERQEDPGVNLLRTPHWIMLGLASILLPLFAVLQPTLIDEHYFGLTHILLPDATWPIALGTGLALLVIAIFGTQAHYKWKPRAAAYATVTWMLVASTIAYASLSRSTDHINPHTADAALLAQTIADYSVPTPPKPGDEVPRIPAGSVTSASPSPLNPEPRTLNPAPELLLLTKSPQDPEATPEPSFYFYAGRSIRPVQADDLADLFTPSRPALLIARDDPHTLQTLAEKHLTPILHFDDGSAKRVLLRPAP